MNRHPSDIEADVHALLDALTASSDPAAFQALLGLSQYLGECLGLSARTLAESQSWGRCRRCCGHHQAGGVVEMAPLAELRRTWRRPSGCHCRTRHSQPSPVTREPQERC
jgi:hypothetical protein